MSAKTRLPKLVAYVVVCCVFALPVGALAFNFTVFPPVHDFGDIAIGQSSTTIVTVTNVGDAAEVFDPVLLGDTTTFRIDSDIPSMIERGQIIDIQITFHPTGEGYFSSTLPVAGTEGTLFGGTGVWSEPPVEPTVAAVLTFFGAAVADGTLVGNGPGNSADGRKGALRNQIEAAGDLISEGYMDEACEQLMNAYLRCDGLPTPPEFVAGDAAPTLAGMILDLIESVSTPASNLVVFPDVHDFGDIVIGQSSTTIVTVTNVGDAAEVFDPVLLGDTTTFRIDSDIPSIINPGDPIDIEITFHPTGEGYFSSTLPVAGTEGTLFAGMGI